MADDETQGPEVTSWWTSDALHDSSLPSATFDEPLVWPESAWDGGEPADGGFDALVEPADDGAEPAVPPVPESDAQWGPSGESADADATVQHVEPLAGLGGGGRGGAAPRRTAPNVPDDLPWPGAVGSKTAEPHGGSGARPPELGSIWSNDFRSDPENLVGFAGLPAPAIYADTERSGGGRRWSRLDVRPGNAAVIGLISIVSLVLLGMFLSVRARNNTPTDTSQARPAGDEISVAGPLNTVPLTTSVTSTSTTTVVPGINIAGLLPPAETAGATPAAGGAGTGSATPTATTAPPRTAAAPTGGGTATTTATTQPEATPAPPATTNVTSPPATSPPDTTPPDTTPTTQRPRPTFTVPTFPTFPGGSFPTFTVPTSNG